MAFTTNNGRTQTALADINITPLVDVVLVLLIIFMVTAPILQSGIEVTVPKTRTVKEITEERTVITINKDQRVFLGNDAININQIADTLRKKSATRATSSSLSAPMKTFLSAHSPR
jgi:biopolymer transport protein TolR